MGFSLEHSSVVVAEAVRAAALLIHALLSWILSSLDLRPHGGSGCGGPPRSSVREIKRSLPVSTYGDLLAAYGGDADGCPPDDDTEPSSATCAVCLNALRRSDEVRELSNCRHVFHRGCLDRWVEHDENGGTCPLCRAPLLHRPPLDPDSHNSWAVDRLIYLFADDVLLDGGHLRYSSHSSSPSL